MDKKERGVLERALKKLDVMKSEDVVRLIEKPNGALGKKLKELTLFKLMGRNNHQFSVMVDMENGGLIKRRADERNRESDGEYDYRTTDNMDWFHLYAPSEIDDYFCQEMYFDLYPELFRVGFEWYAAVRECGNYVKDCILSTKKEYDRRRKEFLHSRHFHYFEMYADCFAGRLLDSMESLEYHVSDEEFEEYGLNKNFKEFDIYRLGFYVALAIEQYVEPSVISSYPLLEAEMLMRSLYCDLGVGEVDILGYTRYFLDFLQDCITLEDQGGYKELLPILARGYFACESTEEGADTMFTYIYRSCNMKKYQDLRKIYPDSEYVPLMDELFERLTDPLGYKDSSVDSVCICEDRDVYYTNFFTEEEFVCGYLMYSCSLGEDEDGKIHTFGPMLVEERSVFDELFTAYEKECRRKENRKKKKAS